MRIVLDSFDEKTAKEFLRRHKVSDTEKAGVLLDFGVIQVAEVNRNARGSDIQGNLILNYRGPFRMSVDDGVLTSDQVVDASVPGQLEQFDPGLEERVGRIEKAIYQLVERLGFAGDPSLHMLDLKQAKTTAKKVKKLPKPVKKAKGLKSITGKKSGGAKKLKGKTKKSLPATVDDLDYQDSLNNED